MKRNILFVLPDCPELTDARELITSVFWDYGASVIFGTPAFFNASNKRKPDLVVCDKKLVGNLLPGNSSSLIELTDREPFMAAVALMRLHALDPAQILNQDYLTALVERAQSQSRFEAPYPTPPPMEGYEFVRLIGRGGMGVVFEVAKHSRRFALKMPDLHWELGNYYPRETDSRLREHGRAIADWRMVIAARFDREARLGSAINHRRIVKVESRGSNGPRDMPFIVMVYEANGSLADRQKLQANNADLNEATGWIRDVAEALVALGQSGIVHRDIKPGNILIDDEKSAKLGDLGAAYEPESNLKLTLPNCPIGTLQYMAPEAFDGFTSSRPPSPQSDIFSLGVSAYEILTGKHPFFFQDGSEFRMKETICSRRPQSPSALVPNFPPTLQSILAKTLKKSPSERYESARELLDDLIDYLNGKAVPTRTDSDDWSLS